MPTASMHELQASDFLMVRKLCRLTQPDFARMIGVHPITISKWETGKLHPHGQHLELFWFAMVHKDRLSAFTSGNRLFPESSPISGLHALRQFLSVIL